MNRSAIACLMTVAALSTHAFADIVATYKDPTLKTGTSSIDPSGSETINSSATLVTGGPVADAATLAARSDIRVIQDFTTASPSNGIIAKGQTGLAGTTNTEVIHFTQSTLPDMQFSLTGSAGVSTGTEMGYNARTTSGSSGVILQGIKSPYSFTFTISFGNYDAASGTFTPGSVGVDAAGFVLGNVTTGINLDVRFLDAQGGVLSQQAAAGANTDSNGLGGPEFFFGYQTADQSYKISSIQIRVEATAAIGNDTSMALDDLAFTTVPEPAALGMLGIGSAGMLLSRRGQGQR